MYDRRGIAELVKRALQNDPTLALSEVSNTLSVGRHTIRLAVRQTWGISFQRLRQQIRLARAVSLLQESPCLTIGEIGVAVGYSSNQSFARFLKRCTGKSPGELRHLTGSASDLPHLPTNSRLQPPK